MKAIDFRTMNVGTKVESVDFENRKCSVRMYSGRKSVLFTDVYMSGLLISRMTGEKSREYYQVGKKYSCDNNETFRKKNPFQFIKYYRDGKVHHLLTVVEDAGTKKIYRGTDMFGNPMEETVFLPWLKKEHYRRYRNRITEDQLAELNKAEQPA